MYFQKFQNSIYKTAVQICEIDCEIIMYNDTNIYVYF